MMRDIEKPDEETCIVTLKGFEVEFNFKQKPKAITLKSPIT